MQAGVDFGQDDTDSLYGLVTVHGCLHLMTSDKAAWQKLLSLQESNPETLDPELADRAKMVTGLICGTFRLGNMFPKVQMIMINTVHVYRATIKYD